MSEDLQRRQQTAHLYGGNAAYLEAFYEQYLHNPDAVPAEWRDYFNALASDGSSDRADVAHGPIQKTFRQQAVNKLHSGFQGSHALAPEAAEKQASVLRLINAYRVRGHQNANIDPLAFRARPPVADLDPAFHGLTSTDLETKFNTGSLAAADQMQLGDIIDFVKGVYTGTVGAEYMHITDTREKRWIQGRLEGEHGEEHFSVDERKELLRGLTAAEGIEKYLHTKYVGQKRFSLEGGESFITSMNALIHQAAKHDVEEVIIGMAHRGRLNVLVNVMGKSPTMLFKEFEGKLDKDEKIGGSGDVKYHMGFSTDVEVADRQMHLVLAFNPSHLEIVNPVVEGSVRARQDRRKDSEGKTILPIIIHGDSAVAGQGVVFETLQLSQVRGFKTGGSVHIIINNQVGFTTSRPDDTRSTEYCSDVAKVVGCPVFHVNGDDPEAVAYVTQLAMDYRSEFKKDVFIDLVCYRRHGHNEADEPRATQPKMYGIISARESTRTLYGKRLQSEAVITADEDAQMIADYRDGLDAGKNIAVKTLGLVGNKYTVDWSKYNRSGWDENVDTGLSLENLRRYADTVTTVPEGFGLHSRVKQIVANRKKMAAGGMAIDWGFAETMAYAGLLDGGSKIRLCGQDAGRGTFFHRHAVFHNQNDGSSLVPLRSIKEPDDFLVIDSLLSEEAVLGFEYGYSTAEPDTLVIWEGQFGDFANGAQVVIDQFIASGEAKWGRLCGLVMFLPHGYEGQGPEHSSARLERYLQLCAEHNMQVCVPSTPAQQFHMIRRQMLRSFRKPLIVMTPKSLLRHRLSTSSLDELVGGRFQPVIQEIDDISPTKAKRVVVCSGKVYFDLLEKRREAEIDDVAIVRLEQLYPFPEDDYAKALGHWKKAKEIVWCQEEPQNQGAWYQIRHRLVGALLAGQSLNYAGRESAASTAAGYHSLHVQQQEKLVREALGLDIVKGQTKTRKTVTKTKTKSTKA